MIEEEIEKQTEEYFCEHCENSFEHDNGHCSNCSKWDYFQAGAKWGIEHAIEWHDLRKDPNDLPKECVEVLVLYTNTYGHGEFIVNKHTLNYELAQYINDEEDTSEWYWVETGTDYDIQKVIAWCELPQFKYKG